LTTKDANIQKVLADKLINFIKSTGKLNPHIVLTELNSYSVVSFRNPKNSSKFVSFINF